MLNLVAEKKQIKRMENRKFEIDGLIENDNSETVEDNSKERGVGIYIVLVVFIVLFLSSVSLFVYYQFYLGSGKWSFNFQKHTEETNTIQQLAEQNDLLKSANDSLLLLLDDNVSETLKDKGLFMEDCQDECYEVQIGYFKSFDFSGYEENLVNMNAEKENNAVMLRIGRFSTFDEACRFRKDIIDMGIKGAFIVKKVNSKRVHFDQPCP